MLSVKTAVHVALLRTAFSAGLAFVANDANGAVTVEELENKLISLEQDVKTIQAQADADRRELTKEEKEQVDGIFAAFAATEEEIARRRRIADLGARTGSPSNRQVGADDTDAGAGAGAGAGGDAGAAARQAQADEEAQRARRQQNSGRANAGATSGGSRRIVVPNDRGSQGFRSFGEFANAVFKAARPGGGAQVDPRLNAALSTYSSEGVGADGGFAVPPDFRTEIITKVFGVESFIGRTDQQTSSSNNFVVPTDDTTPWQETGGIQAYWEGEAGLKQQSKVQLGNMSVKLNKIISLVPVTDELLEDAPSLSNYIRAKAPEKISFKVSDAILNGTGVGMPLGVLNSPATVVVDPVSGQTPDTVVFQNILDMWTRMYAPCRNNAVWVYNQDIETALMSMQFPGTGTAVPVFIPPGGLADSPYGRLLGRPMISSESAAALGDQGDLALIDFSKYLSVTKTGGVRTDISIHLWFDYDVTAFRFVLRIGGQPWWRGPVSPKNGTQTRSCSVVLGERA